MYKYVVITIEERNEAARILREFREKHGLSQAEIAGQFNVPDCYISWLECHTTRKDGISLLAPKWLVKNVLELGV